MHVHQRWVNRRRVGGTTRFTSLNQMKEKLTYKIDQDCIVQWPTFHDGDLCGVFVGKGSVFIHASNYLQERYVVELYGVTELNVFDFWEGNIIGDVFFYPAERIPKLFWNELRRGRADQMVGGAKVVRDHGISGEFYGFSLEGTYGANIYAICRDMCIYSEDGLTP